MIMSVLPFLGLTFSISLAAFLLIATVPGAHTPESAIGFPFWLVAVWAPSLAAFILAWREGQLLVLLRRALQIGSVPWEVWLLLALPLALLFIQIGMAGSLQALIIAPEMLALLVIFNLALGPLGEEFGWRGLMQDRLTGDLGWLGASLAVGVVWYIWHLPLWLVDSPQSEVPVWLFGVHVMAYAVLIGAAHRISGGSLAPAILLHLMFNLSAGWAVVSEVFDTASWYQVTAIPYVLAALLAAGYVARAFPCDWVPE